MTTDIIRQPSMPRIAVSEITGFAASFAAGSAPGARLNFAKNLLPMGADRDPEAPALVFRGEDKVQ